MSADAIAYVDRLAVKGSARDLLRILAAHIPDGQTTTPTLRIADLATEAQLHRRTVLKWVGELVDSGEVTVMDGGRGKKARFTLVHLNGARPPTTAPLPLRADLRPVPPRRQPDESTLDLFAAAVDGEDPAIKRVVIDHTLPPNVWRSITRWLVNVWRSITRWPKRVAIDHTLAPHVEALTTARDVQQLSTTTTTAAAGDAPTVQRLPCRWAGTTHAWCDGRVHVPRPFHDEERRKLARSPGETDADLDAHLFARYAQILAAIPDTEAIADANEFVFWKRVLRSTPRDATPKARVPTPPVRRASTFGAGNIACPHDPMCRSIGDCTKRILADVRAERERKSG